MMDNSTVVSEWKENFRLSQPTSSFLFGGILFLVVNHIIMNFPGVIVACERLGG